MNKKRPFRVLQLVSNDVAEFFPYFFIFYIICLIASFFNESWRVFFYWPAFHLFAFCFALISLFSETVREPIDKNIKKTGRFGKSIFYSAYILFAKLFYRINRLAKKSYLFIAIKLIKLSKKDVIKILIIIIILAFSFYKNIGVMDFIVALYALITIFFFPDIRIGAGVTSILLVICPIALIFKKDGFAELSAIYAYYFLIITAISQIKELVLLKPVEK